MSQKDQTSGSVFLRLPLPILVPGKTFLLALLVQSSVNGVESRAAFHKGAVTFLSLWVWGPYRETLSGQTFRRLTPTGDRGLPLQNVIPVALFGVGKDSGQGTRRQSPRLEPEDC